MVESSVDTAPSQTVTLVKETSAEVSTQPVTEQKGRNILMRLLQWGHHQPKPVTAETAAPAAKQKELPEDYYSQENINKRNAAKAKDENIHYNELSLGTAVRVAQGDLTNMDEVGGAIEAQRKIDEALRKKAQTDKVHVSSAKTGVK